MKQETRDPKIIKGLLHQIYLTWDFILLPFTVIFQEYYIYMLCMSVGWWKSKKSTEFHTWINLSRMDGTKNGMASPSIS